MISQKVKLLTEIKMQCCNLTLDKNRKWSMNVPYGFPEISNKVPHSEIQGIISQFPLLSE